MKIGVIGVGVVGEATRFGLEVLGHDVQVHDIKLKTSVNDVIKSDVCFICVPSPECEDGRCDVSIVESVVSDLAQKRYKGVVAIKSTVEPGTTERLQRKYKTLSLCFVPEFLRERCATADFQENHDLCIIGTKSKKVFNIMQQVHGRYPRQFEQTTLMEAELAKYFNNIYNATLITFANSFHDICNSVGVDYMRVKDMMIKRDHIFDRYLDSNDNFRGFGGICLPKDLKAIIHLGKSKNVDVAFFESIDSQNQKYKKTVFKGMRSDKERSKNQVKMGDL